MELLSTEIKNFGPIEEAYVNLSEKGLVSIEGENKDDPSANSNGAGKSTLPDAIRWCLFGTTTRGTKGDEVIAEFAGKGCVVSTILQDGDDRYMVERWRKDKSKPKSSGVALYRTGADGMVDLSDGTDALTQSKIESILGCSEEVFTKAVYAGQEALPDLPNMTDKQIKLLVEEASGVELLSAAYTYAREHMRECDRAATDADQMLKLAGEAEAQAVETIAVTERRVEEWEGGRKDALAQAAKQRADHMIEAKKLLTEIKAVDKDALEAAQNALSYAVNAVEVEKEEERRLSQELSVATSRAASTKASLASALNRVRIERAAFDGVESKVGLPCDECGKPHTAEDVVEVKALARTRLQKTVEEAQSLKTANDDAEKLVAAADELLTTFRAGMTDVSETMAELDGVRDKLRALERLQTSLGQQRDRIKTVDAEIAKLEAADNPYVAVLNDDKARLKAAKVRFAEKLVIAKEASEALVFAQDAVMILGPSGVRAHVLDTVTPFLNDRTAHYLGTLSDGMIEAVWTTLSTTAKGDLTEKFSIEVSREGGGKSFKALSGGQKRKVRLACALALQDLVASRATKPIRLLILDEVDDALDTSGLERLMTILEEKGREKGTVLIISHNSLKDWCRQSATVTMEGGRSTISGVLS